MSVAKIMKMTEEQLVKLICKNYIPAQSKIFRRFSHNLNLDRNWDYYCGTDIDVLEITKANTIIGYELKGFRKYKGNPEPHGLYEGLNQALSYLNLPYVLSKNKKMLFDGGIFDYVYLVHARKNNEFLEFERRIFKLTPIGFIIVTLDGSFYKVHEASQNPVQSSEAKTHFLSNLDSVVKFKFLVN